MKTIKIIWKFIIDNLDTLIALLLGIYAVWYGYTNNNPELILPILAGTLAIIAFSLIRDRVNREKLSNQVKILQSEIKKISTSFGKSDNYFSTRNDLPAIVERLKESKYTLDIAGTSLSHICVSNFGVLDEMLSAGIKIRLLLSNPENEELQSCLSKRYIEASTTQIHRTQVENSIQSISPLIEKYSKKKLLQVRYTDQVQVFSYIGKDVNKEFGNIQVEFYLHNIGITNDLIIFLHRKEDFQWYQVFMNQFELLWEQAKK